MFKPRRSSFQNQVDPVCCILYMHIPGLKNGPMSFLLKNSVVCSPWLLQSLAAGILLQLSAFLVNDPRWSTSPWRVTPLQGETAVHSHQSSAAVQRRVLLPKLSTLPSQSRFSYPKRTLSYPVSAFVTRRFMQAEMKRVSLCIQNKWSHSALV